MKYRMIVMLIAAAGFNCVFGQEQVTPKDAEEGFGQVQLPPQNTPEYWNVRTEAISEFLPLLTKKRSEMKKHLQVMKDYLLNIGKGSDFTSKNIPVPTDPEIYFEILQMGQELKDMNIPKPKKRPSWNEIMDVVMQHVVFEGYMPTIVEEGEDLGHYVEICKKKEQYGQKVRKDLRSALDQCARMWVYLESINKKADFKAFYADLRSQKEQQRLKEKAQYAEAHRQVMIQQAADKEQQKFEDAEARAHFYSSRKQQAFEGRQNRLNTRAANAGVHYYY